MKVLDKIGLVLFSSIILILSIVLGLLIFGWVDLESANAFIRYILNDSMASNITLGVITVLILLAIKCIFFDSSSKSEAKFEKGVLLENENGKLLVSKETIQNLVSGIVKNYDTTKDIATRVILDKDNSVNIEVTLYVAQDAIIKELSNELQIKIKEVIKKSLDLDVKEVNIKIKNIAPKQETTQE